MRHTEHSGCDRIPEDGQRDGPDDGFPRKRRTQTTARSSSGIDSGKEGIDGALVWSLQFNIAQLCFRLSDYRLQNKNNMKKNILLIVAIALVATATFTLNSL